jgi:hypothetical protein
MATRSPRVTEGTGAGVADIWEVDTETFAPPAQRRWFQERPSEYPWEQDGLDHIRKLMPRTEPHRAWATFSFTASSGRINECDLLIAVPGGLYLV